MRPLAVVAIALLATTGLVGPAVAEDASESPCGPEAVTVVVDAEMLDGDVEARCVTDPADGQTMLETITEAGFHVDGTTEFGSAVVCRVDDAPDQTRESCDAMPSADAFWGSWVASDNEWAFAQEAVDTQTVSAGDVVGLAFQDGPDERQPALSPQRAVAEADPADDSLEEEEGFAVSWAEIVLGAVVVVVLALVLVVVIRRRGRSES